MNNEELTALMHIIPDNDENCDLKRAEIARWYKVYGQKMFYNINEESINKIVNTLTIMMIDNHFWNHNIRLNNLALGEELLKRTNVKQIDHNLISQLYDFSCLLCLEKYICELFQPLDNYNKNWTTEKFVSDILNGNNEGPLIKFWSHYINVVGVENPNPVILSSFKKILSGYSEDFDVNNIDDVWKCGFECAREEGSREALEFFWNKLEHLCTEREEKQETLLYVGINAYELCWYPRTGRNSKDNSFNLVEFSLNHLGVDKYKYFIEEDLKSNKSLCAIFILISNCLYSEAKNLISVVDSQSVSYEDYGSTLVSNNLYEIHKVPCELKKHSFEFFNWVWKLENFEEHRKYCLSDLDHIFRSLVITGEGDSNVLIEPMKLILSSASPEQIRLAKSIIHFLAQEVYMII
ncbi:MAG: hypothetical protein KTV77_04755 [Wolbachia endosymbiont of Fragariocoptes setiger]|nr:hypothetical protein [Wolbachia endosymbiont of Fragariocoptes setiger]